MTPLERLQFKWDVILLKIHALRHELVEETEKLVALDDVLEKVKTGEINISNGLGPYLAQKERELAEAEKRLQALEREIELEGGDFPNRRTGSGPVSPDQGDEVSPV